VRENAFAPGALWRALRLAEKIMLKQWGKAGQHFYEK
jgi:hypothetical protein